MGKYLWRGSYTTDGLKGLMQEGAAIRRKALEDLLESLGGRLESMYFAFGEEDLYLVYEAPDNVAAAAGAMAVAASGAARGATIVLLTSEEVDEARERTAIYRPPEA